ncbi:MAG: DNA-directed RNA polymerase subunit alpha [Lentisphaerae bacterium]|nr:DNA-directed RNA polymerase subunit alpha [Lentisphaerota bacterium]
MTIKIGRFEMPKRVVKDDSSASNVYGKFIAEPFESGYARTLGNSLRRVLLSSLEGAAISAVKIDGVFHEFCALKGAMEDVTDVILNLKKVLLRTYSREPRWIRLSAKGPGEVTAANIQADNMVEVLNPSQYIATLAEDGKFDAELEVSLGRGFVPAESNRKKDQDIGIVPVDCIYSPIRRVNYIVENTRVGRRTDYEKLIMEIWTDERMLPDDALVRAATILRHHLDVFVNYDEDIVEFEESEKMVDHGREELRKKLGMSVNEIELSVRAANCLNNANILSVGELAQKTEAEMLKYRNFGKKSLNEIKQKLQELELSLGMTIDEDLLKKTGQDARKA